nr:hypothetical protein Iba_chr10aCG13670 [Ipomoea batatas]
METTHPADRTRLVVKTRIVAPTQAQIERVGEDAHLLEVIMSIAQTMHVLLTTIRRHWRSLRHLFGISKKAYWSLQEIKRKRRKPKRPQRNLDGKNSRSWRHLASVCGFVF